MFLGDSSLSKHKSKHIKNYLNFKCFQNQGERVMKNSSFGSIFPPLWDKNSAALMFVVWDSNLKLGWGREGQMGWLLVPLIIADRLPWISSGVRP